MHSAAPRAARARPAADPVLTEMRIPARRRRGQRRRVSAGGGGGAPGPVQRCTARRTRLVAQPTPTAGAAAAPAPAHKQADHKRRSGSSPTWPVACRKEEHMTKCRTDTYGPPHTEQRKSHARCAREHRAHHRSTEHTNSMKGTRERGRHQTAQSTRQEQETTGVCRRPAWILTEWNFIYIAGLPDSHLEYAHLGLTLNNGLYFNEITLVNQRLMHSNWIVIPV